jgi:two-component system chemotaxis response regulator CheY
VLFAEDDNDLREVMTIFLTQMGYSVTACGDAEFASEAFHCDAHIEILMTDLEMPGRSGLELARELTAFRPSLAVMIVSGAFITPEMSAEMNDRDWKYLSKRCGLPAVLDVLQSLHSKHSQSSVA